MTDHEKESIQTLERAARLYLLTSQEGWDDLLDIMEKQVTEAEFRLLNLPSGAENQVLRDTHAYAKVARSFFEQVQLRVISLIEAGQAEATIKPSTDIPQYSNF
jgi:hypothetical protein